jgi:hypothetical protein
MVRAIGGQIFHHTFGAVGDDSLKDFVAILKRIIAILHQPAFAIPHLTPPRRKPR